MRIGSRVKVLNKGGADDVGAIGYVVELIPGSKKLGLLRAAQVEFAINGRRWSTTYGVYQLKELAESKVAEHRIV